MPVTTGASFDGVDDSLSKTWSGKTQSSSRKLTVAGWFEAPDSSSAPSFQLGCPGGGVITFVLTDSNGFGGVVSTYSPAFYIASDDGSAVIMEKGASSYSSATKYFMMASIDTTQAVQADRCKLWFGAYNGPVALISGWTDLLGGASGLGLNDDFERGSSAGNAEDYLSEDGSGTYRKAKYGDLYYLDGIAAADPSAFVSNYATAAVPGTYSGSYGNMGFHLDFTNSGALGADSSGNANNFTVKGAPVQLTGYFPSTASGSLIFNPLRNIQHILVR